MARILSFGLIAAALAAPAEGFWWGVGSGVGCGEECGCQDGCEQAHAAAYLDHCKAKFHVNQRWPSPYLCPDRTYAHAPFKTMVSNGWRRQNLMGTHHFSHDASKLTQAGELKVQWIMTQAPPAYRRMFVERSVDPEVTARRMETIREYSERIALSSPIPEVAETHIFSEGRPAATVDFVNTRFQENMRVPMLPASGLSSGGEQ